VDCRIGVVNKLDRRLRRRVLVIARSTCRGEIFQVRSLGQSPRGKYPDYWRYRNFLLTQYGIVEGSLRAKNELDSSSRFNTIPVCDVVRACDSFGLYVRCFSESSCGPLVFRDPGVCVCSRFTQNEPMDNSATVQSDHVEVHG